VRVFEGSVAALLALAGVHSLVHWIRRPFLSRSVRDHALYALWVTGRVGLWFAMAAVFAISASIDAQGRAFVDEFARYRWFVLVPLVLAALQLLAALGLRRAPDGEAGDPPKSDSD
jgi:hypothetical protein